MFDTFDRTGAAEFDFPKEVVFRAIREAVIATKGMKLQEASTAGSFLTVKTGASAMSWGENIKISVTSPGGWKSQVSVASAGKTLIGSATTHGKNQKNISTLIHATSEILDRRGIEWAQEMGLGTGNAVRTSHVNSVADELKKLVELRDNGILSHEEFNLQKARLLET